MIDIETKWATGIYAPLYTLCFLLKKNVRRKASVCERERASRRENYVLSRRNNPEKKKKKPGTTMR